MAGALVRGPIYSSNPSTMNISNVSNSDELKPRCKCCPYGYHIDLDFVQFCELFSQNNTLSASKQRRREKRLQRQSMEVLLGLTSPVVWNLEQHLPKIPQEDCVISSSNSSQTAKIVQDALHGAVQDFQDTLERAQCASFTDKTIFMPTNEDLEEKYIFSAGASPELEVCAAVGKHSESAMSLSSIGTPSYSPAYANRDIPDGLMYSAVQGMSPINDYDTSSITSAASGLSAGALQNIREQMALSLKRMKELEEQVKLIPVLQVQLSVLKEEKRKLLLQLRQEEVTKVSDKLVKPDTLPQASKQNFESLKFHNTVPRCSKGDENKLFSTCKEDADNRLSVCHYCSKLLSHKETQSQSNFKDIRLRQKYQDVGVTCSVVTRDVGVCHQQPRMYDAETYVNFGEKFVTLENNNKINLTSTRPSQPPVEKHLYIPNSLNGILSKRDIAVNTFWQRNRIGVQTEISQCHAATQKDFFLPNPEKVFVSFKTHKDKKMRKLKARLKRKFKNHSIAKRHSVGVMTEFEDVSGKPEKDDESVQHLSSLESKSQKSTSVATCPFMPTSSSKSIDTSEFYASRIKDAAVNTLKVQVTDVAVGDRNINVLHRTISAHLPYESSQNKYRDIAVNTQKAEVVDVGVGNQMYNLFQRSVSCQCNTTPVVNKGSYKDSATNTVKTKVIDIAVGSRYTNLFSKNVSCQCNIQSNDIKGNFRDDVKVKTVDAIVGCEDSCLLQRSVSCQCDSITEEFLVNSSKKSPSLSRIPRPIDRNVMTSQNAKEKINFQDCEKEYTYTKFPLYFDPEKKINKTVSKENVVIEKEHIEEVSRKLAAVPTESTCVKLKVDDVELLDERPLVQEKRFRTGTASLGLHMLGTSKFENSIQKELVKSNTESNLEHSFTFQPIQDVERKKSEPSKEMKAAIKVLNDCLMKSNFDVLPNHAKSAANIIQQEWFHVSSTSTAVPQEVEDYLDFFEETSSKLLEYVVNMTDISGNTAMHYAVSHGNFDVVSILLDSKVCNINQPNAAGYTCVMLVSLAEICSETHSQVVRRLFQLADVNVRAQQHGQTALMLAVSHGRLDTVKLLVEAGADMNIQDEDGSTALMCAAEHGHKDIVKQLLSNPDCDVGIADCDGTTALDIAMEAGNRDIGVLIYGRQAFSRSTSPHTSRHRRSKSATPVVNTSSPMRMQSPQTTGVIKARHDKTL